MGNCRKKSERVKKVASHFDVSTEGIGCIDNVGKAFQVKVLNNVGKRGRTDKSIPLSDTFMHCHTFRVFASNIEYAR